MSEAAAKSSVASDLNLDSASLLVAEFVMQKRRRARRFTWLAAGSQALILANLLLFTYGIGTLHVSLKSPLLMLGVIVGNVIAIAPLFVAPGLLFLRPSRRQREILEQLEHVDDVVAIPALWESLSFSDKLLTGLANDRLALLLPRLGREHRSLLNDQLLRGLSALPLHALLGKFKAQIGEKLALASLTAVAELGDERNVDDIRKMTDAHVEDGRGRRIQSAAADCLSRLEARLAVEARAGTLLRPADTAAGPQNLLRPALNNTVDMNLLLQPVSPQGRPEP